MLRSSDQLPGDVAAEIRNAFPFELETWRKTTYGCAARRLLEIVR